MPLPRVDRVDAEVAEIVELATSIVDRYRWFAPWAYSQRQGGDGIKVGGGESHSDPTYRAWEDGRKVREECDFAVRQLRLAKASLLGGHRALCSVDPREPRDDLQEVLAGELLPKREMQDVKASQARRLERGEGVPE